MIRFNSRCSISILALIIMLSIVALPGCFMSKGRVWNAFNTRPKSDEVLEKRNYIIKTDGTKEYGEQISWQQAYISKNLTIDGKKINRSDIKWVKTNSTIYANMNGLFVARFLHGKINLYYAIGVHGGNTSYSQASQVSVYYQVGDEGKIIELLFKKQIKEIVSGCELAVNMVDDIDTDAAMHPRNIKVYMNEVFEIYNNDCRKVR